MRDAPSLVIIPGLQALGAKIRAYDPEGMEEASTMFENVEFCDDAYHAMTGADIAVILTEWNQFRAMNLKRISETLTTNTLIDLRNIYPLDAVRELDYHSIGRPS